MNPTQEQRSPRRRVPGTRIAVIGAGMAGITCARRLRDRGLEVVVFEKSRGVGGRLATRRTAGGLAFDHGAQFVTARTPAFATALDAWGAAPWRPLMAAATPAAEPWRVGVPAMNALVKPWAGGITVHLQTRVQGLERGAQGWLVRTAEGRAAEAFDAVALAIPAPQAHALVAHIPELAGPLATVTMAPCWTLMTAFDTPLELPFDVWRRRDHDLAWACRNASKPGRDADAECWVMQAGAQWSKHHRDAAPEAVADDLMALFAAAVGQSLPRPRHRAAHRWLYALVERPLGRPCLVSHDGTVVAGGDWCLAPRVEAAFTSGEAMAAALPGAP